MFELFSATARKVMALANQEAQLMQSDYVRPEHVLIGLVREGEGNGAQLLRAGNIDTTLVRAEVLRRRLASAEDIPEPHTKTVIADAIEASKELKDTHLGTEHFLLGLFRLP